MADSPELASAEKDVFKIVAAVKWLLERMRRVLDTLPTASTDNAVARFDGTTGLLQDSAFIVDDSGHVSSFGGNIKFPATQVASADANTLDDYEEGTFTPGISFTTPGDLAVTYTLQTGTYTKKGREVTVSALVIAATFTHTTAAGNLLITGLPFTVGNSAFGNLTFTGITKATYTNYTGQTLVGTTTIGCSAAGSGVAAAAVVAADVPSGGTPLLGTTICYNI